MIGLALSVTIGMAAGLWMALLSVAPNGSPETLAGASGALFQRRTF